MENTNEIILPKGHSLDEYIKNSDKPVLVDYYADWCGPCVKLGPIIHEAQKKADYKFKVIKVNVDDHGELSEEKGISGIPFVEVYKDGKVIGNFTGMDEQALNKLIGQL
jgi:thioredoxin 1